MLFISVLDQRLEQGGYSFPDVPKQLSRGRNKTYTTGWLLSIGDNGGSIRKHIYYGTFCGVSIQTNLWIPQPTV